MFGNIPVAKRTYMWTLTLSPLSFVERKSSGDYGFCPVWNWAFMPHELPVHAA
jgi:hypothetical protein